jgi:hypothetical protein
MKIFVDENIPLMTVRALREMGHDVRDIRGTADEWRGLLVVMRDIMESSS